MSMIPGAAVVSINDLLDQAAKVMPGQQVTLIAHVDGLHGGDNLVDMDAISWIQAAIQFRGARASVLWIDEPSKLHAWRLPPVVKAAMKASDITILHSFDITFEEIVELKQFVYNEHIRMVRNFATTAPLLCTAWAQTPHELVSAIRYQSLLPLVEGASWQLTDPNGTHLEGVIQPALNQNHPWFSRYAMTREEGKGYLPWPEWIATPVRLDKTNGEYIFNDMLSWWSRYIGIAPCFDQPVRLTIADGKITAIQGGPEAKALQTFLESMRERLGDGVYDFNCLHWGVHPNASVPEYICPNVLYRRLIDHSHSSNLHAHIGAPSATSEYPYWMHITGDIRTPTLKVGETVILDAGHLTVLDSPVIKAIAENYPGRPGLGPEPKLS